jgi:N-acetylglucosamine kinase-like BadF-type ATPase
MDKSSNSNTGTAAIGIDLGGTKTEAVLLNPTGTVIGNRDSRLTCYSNIRSSNSSGKHIRQQSSYAIIARSSIPP